MPRTFALTTSTALFALITPQIALAEVNAQDVWANYQAYIKAFGGTASADVSTKGNVTRLSDMTMSFAFPFGLLGLGFLLFLFFGFFPVCHELLHSVLVVV